MPYTSLRTYKVVTQLSNGSPPGMWSGSSPQEDMSKAHQVWGWPRFLESSCTRELVCSINNFWFIQTNKGITLSILSYLRCTIHISRNPHIHIPFIYLSIYHNFTSYNASQKFWNNLKICCFPFLTFYIFHDEMFGLMFDTQMQVLQEYWMYTYSMYWVHVRS